MSKSSLHVFTCCLFNLNPRQEFISLVKWDSIELDNPSAEDMALAIKPDQNDVIIDKHTASIFIDTRFERMIRNAGIVTIVFAGIATEFGEDDDCYKFKRYREYMAQEHIIDILLLVILY